MILIQVIITPNLTFLGSTADFIKILEQSNIPIGGGWHFLPTAMQTYGKFTYF